MPSPITRFSNNENNLKKSKPNKSKNNKSNEKNIFMKFGKVAFQQILQHDKIE
jgi:hypothetical protein